MEIQMSTPKKIRWLIAHQPEELFVRTATAFSQELAKHCGDSLEVEILTYPSYVEKYGEIEGLDQLAFYDEDSDPGLGQTRIEKGLQAFWAAMTDGKIEMSQMQVGQIGALLSDFAAMDLPYLFNDHDHVSRVVDGTIGQQMCQDLADHSGVRGLAFTYSGGYRVLGSDEPVMSLDDLQGLRLVIEQPLSLGHAIEQFGVKTMKVKPNLWKKLDLIANGAADAIETTYLRFFGKHIFKTNHSMFLTTILINNRFWDSLTEHEQLAFSLAARHASVIERQWAIDDAARFEKEAQSKGVSISTISIQDENRLKRASQKTYLKYNGWFSKDLISKIRKA